MSVSLLHNKLKENTMIQTDRCWMLLHYYQISKCTAENKTWHFMKCEWLNTFVFAFAFVLQFSFVPDWTHSALHIVDIVLHEIEL